MKSNIIDSLISKKKDIDEKTIHNFPKRIEQQMSDSDFSHLVNATKDNTIVEFIKKYQEQNEILTYDDVITLALIKATSEPSWIGKIPYTLSKRLLSVREKANAYSLVTLDAEGNNIILYALKNYINIELLTTYIHDLESENRIDYKFAMGEDLTQKLAYVISHPEFDSYPETYINDLIVPLYTHEAVEYLRDVIGRDWLDSYYC